MGKVQQRGQGTDRLKLLFGEVSESPEPLPELLPSQLDALFRSAFKLVGSWLDEGSLGGTVTARVSGFHNWRGQV